jgi:uncharacterized protein involved in exopolysaccharide biosynthesis
MSLSQTDIPFTEAIGRIFRNWRLIAACTIVTAGIGVATALTARRVFVSETVMVPLSQNSQGIGGGIAKRLSGLASVAGITLGGSQENDSRDAAIATLSSYQTLSTFLSTEGIQKQVLDESRRDLFSSLGIEHSNTMWEAVREFKKHLFVTQEKDSSLIRLSIEWYNPASASVWTNHLVAFADARIRSRALDTARGRITFLQKELEHNPILAVRDVISGMMENEFRTMATADADKEFAFRIIDPAIPAERPARPHRVFIVAAFGLCGLLFGSILAVLFDRSHAIWFKNIRSGVRSTKT